MFSITERDRLRALLISSARTDERITGIALTGSASTGTEDRWSDIDLAFGFAAGTELPAAIADWTAVMYADHGAVHHLDVVSGATTYRVFLLASTLQVDLAFAPEAEFGATAPTFRLLSGKAVPRPQVGPPDAAELIGLAWLYGLHARSSLARGRVWQAEYMVSGVRDHVLALACLRYGLPARQGRGMDRLPAEVTGPLAGALVRGLDAAELERAFGVATRALLTEIDLVDAALAARLSPALRELAGATLRRLHGLPGVTGAEESGANWLVGLVLSRGLTAFAGRRRSDVTLRGI